MSVDYVPPEENAPSVSAFRLMLIGDQPVFQMGLRIWFERFPDLDVVAEADSPSAALETLDSIAPDLNLVILTLGHERSDRESNPGFDLCQQMKARFPDLPILLLGSFHEPVMLAAAQQVGANGYCPRDSDATELVMIVRRVAIGQSHWMLPATAAGTGLIPRDDDTVRQMPSSKPIAGINRSFAVLRRNLRRSGIEQIEATLVELTAQLQNPELSLLDRAILAGQHRELRAARWVVKQLLATPALSPAKLSEPPITEATTIPQPESGEFKAIAPLVSLDNPAQAIVRLQSVLFDAVLPKLQTSLQNQTAVPLEIDVLREDRKRELFYLILRQIEQALDELRYSQVEAVQLAEKRLSILTDLWQSVTIDFFGKYYTVRVQGQEIEIVRLLLDDCAIVQTEILNKIPFVPDLFSHLLFQEPLWIEGTAFTAGNPEALIRAEAIFENLMIQVANAVLQPLINRFAKVEAIKQNFYDRRLMSSREIERFRNNLSWKYRLDRYVTEPRAIFESQHPLLTFQSRGIRTISVYAPRTEELEELQGLRYVLTIALETRDAISPRLRSMIAFLGSGVVYVLTEVVGRGIGLIGRGILKGVGGAWQDNRFSRNSEGQK